MNSHIVLLWAGACIFVLMCLLSAVIRESSNASQRAQTPARLEPTEESEGFIAELRTSLTNVGKVPWFCRYLIAEVLYLSIGLALPFYAIHAASLHHHETGSLPELLPAALAMRAAGSLRAAVAPMVALRKSRRPRPPEVRSPIFFSLSWPGPPVGDLEES